MRRRRAQYHQAERQAAHARRVTRPSNSPPLTLEEALWAGDVDRLQEIARCICCCADHTFPWCPARAWHGCRGGGPDDLTPSEKAKAWAEHYEQFHGMTREQFFA